MTPPAAPPDDLDVTLLLAEGATANPDGTLDVRSLGWCASGSEPPEHVLLVWVTAPADRAGGHLLLELRLVDGDGRPVESDGPRGVEATRVDGRIAVPPADHLPAGRPVPCLPAVVGVKLAGGLAAGVYEWRCEIDGITKDHWKRTFLVQDDRVGPSDRP